MTTSNPSGNAHTSGGAKGKTALTPAQKKMQDAISKSPAAKKKVADNIRMRNAIAKSPAAKKQIAANMAARQKAAQQAAADAAVRKRLAENQGTRDTNPTTTPWQDASTLAQVQKAFADLGLPTLFNKVATLYKSGIKDQDSILFQLRDTDEYKKRFAANEKRRQQGLPELSPGTYVKLEQSYEDILRTAGLPDEFYNHYSDYQHLIENNISATQVQERANWAKQATVEADPSLVNALKSMYGVNQGDIVAYFLDPEHTQALLDRRQAAAQFQASAARAGQQFSTDFADEAGAVAKGNRAQNDSTFASIGDDFAGAQRLDGVYDENLSAEDLARDAFNMTGGGAAREKRNRLASKERASFGGRSSGSSGTLSQRKDI